MGSPKHNSAPEAKARLRHKVVDLLGGPAACSVLETHSGPGEMRRRAYGGARDWLGIDRDPKAPDAIHADNALVLRAIDLGRFNLFDVDAFGSPWECVWLIARRRPVRPGETIAVVITDGLHGGPGKVRPSLNAWSREMCAVIGARGEECAKYFCGREMAERIGPRFVSAWFAPASLDKWLAALGHGAQQMIYAAAILVGR
jgi:hypothetical protein